MSAFGTATAPLYLAHRAGVPFRVFADETRPLLQGARLTAWELSMAGIDVTLICDNMAATLMSANEIDLVLVGTDRVTRNGDVVNKIGTLNLAVLCRHYGVPFYVACPSSTFDPATPTGAEVVIEERDPAEVLGVAAARVPARNPAFDVTPAALVDSAIASATSAMSRPNSRTSVLAAWSRAPAAGSVSTGVNWPPAFSASQSRMRVSPVSTISWAVRWRGFGWPLPWSAGSRHL